MEENNSEKRDIVFAIFLIFIGIIFLFNTTGVVGWGIWEYIFRFWPVFLILGGIKLILGHSVVTEIVITTLAIILFLVAGISSYISYTSKFIPFLPTKIQDYLKENPDWLSPTVGNDINENTKISTSKYENITKRVLNVNVGASKFSLSDSDTDDEYIALNSVYTKGYIEPSLESEKEDEVLNIKFETVSPSGFRFWNRRSPEFNLVLGSKDLPTDISVILGAGKGVIDLDEVVLNEVTTKVGAGELIATFKENALPEKLSLDIGAGSVVLNIPKEVGYNLSYDLGVGEISQNNNSIASALGKNDEYVSSNYDEAEVKIEIVARVGVGSLKINNI